MKRAVIATGDVRQQVERFILVARMADQQDLSDQEKRPVLRRRTSGTDRILGS
jgi:hypothetical protein